AGGGGGGWMKPVGIAAIVVGGVGIVGGAVTGALAVNEHSVLVDECPFGKCTRDSQGTLDNFHTFSTISTIAFVVGVVGLGGGIALVALAPSGNKTGAIVRPYVGASSVGVGGRF